MRRIWKQPRLITQMIGFISIVVLVTVLSVSAIFTLMTNKKTEETLGNQAMIVAKMTAQNQRIIEAFTHRNPSSIIQPIAEEIRKLSGAGYVVIGNKDNIRYSHHLIEHIGKEMGTSNQEVFEKGASIIFRGTGISGEAIKAKTPIYDENGKIIGVSSVGFLTTEEEKIIKKTRLQIFYFTIFIILLGIIGAFLIARRVKKLIFNLEPEEISFLFKEKEATIESIRDAIIAVNKNFQITSINKRAREILQTDGINGEGTIDHPPLVKMIKCVVITKNNLVNQKLLLGKDLYMVDAAPIIQKNETSGAVLTIRPFSDFEQFSDEVSEIKTISDSIRAQNHEYLNKLNLIYGLMALEQYDEARKLISDEVKERQDIVVFLTSSVKSPYIAACLLGKINRAKELKVLLELDEESNMEQVPPFIDIKHLVTVIGNVVDNALEAAVRNSGEKAHVKVSFTDVGNDIVFDIEDNGIGIPEELNEMVFMEGFTTKQGENHGLGLAIVKNIIDSMSGEIYIGRSELGGARITISVPKRFVERGEEYV